MTKNILIVDDDKAITSQHRLYFESVGYGVVEANSVERAMVYFRDLEIHGIITDITMEPRDGIDFIQAVRAIDKKIPIICVSSAGEKFLQKAVNHGGNLGFEKPVAPLSLTNAMEKLLKAWPGEEVLGSKELEDNFDDCPSN